MTSHQVKIEKLVARKTLLLESQPITRSKLRVILHDCGWKKRGAENLSRIQTAFEEAGIYPEPILTAPGLEWNQMIYFSTEKPDPYFPDWYAPQHAFPTERALQLFLVENFDQIPEFKKYKQPVIEHELPSKRRIDILCRERKSNAYVVIELKKHDTDPTDQLHQYMVELEKQWATTGKKSFAVKGMIITGEPNAALERSLPDRIPDYPVQWYLYRAEVKLHRRAKTI